MPIDLNGTLGAAFIGNVAAAMYVPLIDILS